MNSRRRRRRNNPIHRNCSALIPLSTVTAIFSTEYRTSLDSKRERDVAVGSEWWSGWLRKNLHVVVVAVEAKLRRERDEREVGRMAREGERNCEEEEDEDSALTCYARKKQQQQREEEAAAKQREETETTRGGKSFCVLKEEIQTRLLVATAFVCRIRTRLPLTTAFVFSCKII